MGDQVNGGPAERAVYEGLVRAGFGEHGINLLLDSLQEEWSAETKDKHLHSFDSIALCDDYCQKSGCFVTYEEYLEGL